MIIICFITTVTILGLFFFHLQHVFAWQNLLLGGSTYPRGWINLPHGRGKLSHLICIFVKLMVGLGVLAEDCNLFHNVPK